MILIIGLIAALITTDILFITLIIMVGHWSQQLMNEKSE